MRRPRPGIPVRLRPGITLPVQGGAGPAEQLARLPGRGERFQPGECLIDHLGGFLPESALPESSSKSACAFPITSTAAFVLASSAVSFSFSFRSRSLSTSAALRAGRPAGLAERPLSRASRHCWIWEWYRPSRRSSAPRSRPPASWSYSSTIASLYARGKVRRFGRSARGPRAEATRPSSPAEDAMSATVNVTYLVDPVSPY